MSNNKERIKINYVALGDAFAAGYNSKFGFPTNGYLNKDNEIIGLCYPSTFASLIKDSEDFSLNSFYNLSVSYGNLDFLNALYTNNKKELKRASHVIDLIQAIDWFASNPFKDYYSNFLNDWNINKNDFLFFYKKIKEANIITLTAGFHDFFITLPFKRIILLGKNALNNNDFISEIKEIKSLIKEAANTTKNKLIYLIKLIKNINPKAKFILTNYSELFLNLKESINSIINPNNIEYNNLYNYITTSLDSFIKEAAKEEEINFIDINDIDYWDNNKNYLFENIFSIYPTEKGYKKIGNDIYTKLFSNKNSLIKKLEDNNFINKYISNKEYWLNDISLYSSHSLKSDDISYIFNKVYGANKNELIYLLNKNEKAFYPYLNYKIRLADFIGLFLRYYHFSISDIVNKYITDIFKKSKNEYKITNKLITFLSNQQRIKEVILVFLKNQKIDNILYILEQILYKNKLLNNKNINIKLIKNELIKILKDNQNLVYDVLKHFFNSDLIRDSRTEIKEIIELFIKESLETDLLNFLFKYKVASKVREIIDYLLSLDSLKTFINFFIESLINNADIYIKLENFDQLWSNFIIKNKHNLILLFDKILLELTEDEKINQTTEFLVKRIKDSLRLELDSKYYKALKTSVFNILNIFKNNPKYFNNIITKILDKLKDISVYDLIFKLKENNKKIFKLSSFISINRFLIIGIRALKNLVIIKNIIEKHKL